MKRLRLVYFLSGAIILIALSCSKDNRLVPGQSPDDVMTAKRAVNVHVFIVYPSGDDDTDNLKGAFEDAMEAGPGSIVKLVEGNYTIRDIEIHQFFGSFIGAGKGKTVISSSPDLLCAWMASQNTIVHLMQFVGGDVTIADMTFKINDGYSCSDEYGYPGESSKGHDLQVILLLSDYTEVYRPETRYIKAIVRNVEFIGGNDDGTGAAGSQNTIVGFWVTSDWWWPIEGMDYPLFRGDVRLGNCTFDNCWCSAEISSLGPEAEALFEKNIFSNELIGPYVAYNYGGKIVFRDNDFRTTSFAGLYIDDYDWGALPYLEWIKRTYYDISNNSFNVDPSGFGLYMVDSRLLYTPDNALPQQFNVRNNRFSMSEGSTGIYGLNTQDGMFRGNIFSGEGSVGIGLDGTVAEDGSITVPAKNDVLLGNNFSGCTFTDAMVFLGAGTMECTVAGNSNSGTIVDNGEGNSITGMKASHTPMQIGPAISEVMKMLAAVKK